MKLLIRRVNAAPGRKAELGETQLPIKSHRLAVRMLLGNTPPNMVRLYTTTSLVEVVMLVFPPRIRLAAFDS